MFQLPTPPPPWLRRTDQATVAVLTLVALGVMLAYWGARRASGPLVEFEHARPLVVEYRVDLNQASWPELAQIPGVGESLARRIVNRRETRGPYADARQLREIPGVGPRTYERITPYLRPMPEVSQRVDNQ